MTTTANSGTTATGGSADSQATDAAAMWTASPTIVRVLKALIWATPLFAGYVAGLVFTAVVDRPDGVVPSIAWVLGILVVSSLTIHFTRPVIDGATPLAFLYQCTLVFPDQAPSRFKIALAQRSARDLQRRVESGELLDTPEEAATAILTLLAHLNDHDRRTRGHSERVRAYSDLIAEQLGLPEADRHKLHWAALLHDIGKLSVDPDILNKPGRPDDHEWQQLRGHPAAAPTYLRALRPWLGQWLDAATQHHERWDGKGYPRALAGDDISLSGRIVAVADAYDVMTSSRSYKTPWSADDARAELARCAGTQFDPRIVRAFLQVSSRRLEKVAGPISWLGQWPSLAEVAHALGSAGTTTVGSLATAAGAAAITVTPAIVVTYDGPIAAGAVTTTTTTTVETTVPSSAPDDTVVVDEPATSSPVVPTPTTVNTPTSAETSAPADDTAPTTDAPTVTPPTAPETSAPTSEAPTTDPSVPSTEAPPVDPPPTTPTTEAPGTSGVLAIAAGDLPAVLSTGALQSDEGIFYVPEGPPREIETPFDVVAPGPADVTGSTTQVRTIAAGTQVCTYLLHADSPEALQTFDVTIQLTESVIGFAASTEQLVDTATWGVDDVDYVDDGIEDGDWIRVDDRTLLIRMHVEGDRDQVRIFTGC